ncbi:MAG: DNA mismatch repair endonuclease MutL [Prolixibacteraceae bacterium]|nr:DNA mismatch repair endonuclease MutL [Prolixibacteraceae bacterium]MBN2649709.1 DNA mismatch repair endonuclease MutL [Prolixibacteraceae bacterium]
MSDIIHLLSDSVANQIAAGEVIQRPASVVKELVENAIDAGATKILIHVKDAGRTLIQVSDNGKGMSPTDARMAFERHATSKINDAGDLFSIRTMGFRGEALASIASVADVEMKTKSENDEIGTFIHISGSELISQEATATTSGTTFCVKNLFYNVPARRKFLKTNATEIRHIMNEIQRVALANPSISFSLYHNDSPIYDLPADNLKKRIVHIFGNSIGNNLVPIEVETSIAHIKGFIGDPKMSRRSFGEQFFFVNGRYMKHPFFHKAIMQGYEKIMPRELVPAYFINFTVEASSIDINIHPTKTEIKFENESAVWQLLQAAVREGLGKFNVIPSIDFDQEGSIDIPLLTKSPHDISMPQVRIDPTYNPFQHDKSVQVSSRGFSNHPEKTDAENWEKLYGEPRQNETPFADTENEQSSFLSHDENTPVESGRNLLQIKNKYILTPVKSGLMVIDQRRAHQRILFEQFMVTLTNEEGYCQQLLFPQTIELNHADAVLFETMMPDLNAIGFDIREFGPGTYIINGTPGFIDDTNVKHIIETAFAQYKESNGNIKDETKEKLATSLAIASSISYGQTLTSEEAGSLIDSLFACQTPNYSPTGKPVIEIIKLDEMEKRFK